MEGQPTGIALIVVGTTQPNPLPTTTKELGERERAPLEFLKVKRNNAKSFRNMLYRIKIIATKDYVSTICFAKTYILPNLWLPGQSRECLKPRIWDDFFLGPF